MRKVFFAYFKTAIKNKKIFIKSYLDITSNIWRFNLPKDYPFFVIIGRPTTYDINGDEYENGKNDYKLWKIYLARGGKKISYKKYHQQSNKSRKFLKEKPIFNGFTNFLVEIGKRLFWGDSAYYYPFARGSLYLILLLIIQIPLYKKYGFDMCFSNFPMFLYLGTLCLTIPAPDTRYFYQLILWLPFMFVICIFGGKEKRK